MCSYFLNTKKYRNFHGQSFCNFLNKSILGLHSKMTLSRSNNSQSLHLTALISNPEIDLIATIICNVLENHLTRINLRIVKEGTVMGLGLGVLLRERGVKGDLGKTSFQSGMVIEIELQISNVNQISLSLNMLDSRFKKQIGFIKQSTSKSNLRQNVHIESSDSFSSFEYDPKSKNQEFSPYRHPIEKITNKKSASQAKKTKKDVKNQEDNDQPHFSNLVLKNNFIQETRSKQRQVNKKLKNQLSSQEITDVNEKINKLKENVRKAQQNVPKEDEQNSESQKDANETPQLKNGPQQESQELSLSNINRFKRTEQEYTSNPLPEEVQQKHPKTLAQYQKYLEESSSQSDSQEQRINHRQTMKNKNNAPHRPQRRNQRQEELICEWDKRQFKDKTMKTAIQQHNALHERPPNKKGIIENKGGICFAVDKRQFKGPADRPQEQPQKKKKRPALNTRQQLIIRRETAKRYDRQARVRLFGYA